MISYLTYRLSLKLRSVDRVLLFARNTGCRWKKERKKKKNRFGERHDRIGRASRRCFWTFVDARENPFRFGRDPQESRMDLARVDNDNTTAFRVPGGQSELSA